MTSHVCVDDAGVHVVDDDVGGIAVLVEALLLDPGEGAEGDLAHAVAAVGVALLGPGAVFGGRHEALDEGVDILHLYSENMLVNDYQFVGIKFIVAKSVL